MVISLAGNKGVFYQAPGPFIYTDEDNCKVMGLDPQSKKLRQKEEFDEWRRLLYVDYTRAESLLIVPIYKKWFEGNSNQFVFLSEAESALSDNLKECVDVQNLEWDRDALKSRVDAILQSAKSSETLDLSDAEHRLKIKNLAESLGAKSIFPYSYSSLSGHGDSSDVTKDGSR